MNILLEMDQHQRRQAHNPGSLELPTNSGQWSPSSTNSSTSSLTDVSCVADGAYEIHWKIGSGSYGDVYFGVHSVTRERVAIKMEKISQSKTLGNESRFLNELQGTPGVPKWMYYGEQLGYRVLVMELLGPSLESVFRSCHRQFSVKTVLMLGDQLVTLVEHIHASNIIHRDLKPENILTANDNFSSAIYTIDFGLANRFRHPVSYEHIPEKKGRKGIIGTSTYASLKCHSGYDISRRDDLESIAYMLIYFLKGELPWRKRFANDQNQLFGDDKKKHHEKVKEIKMSMPISVLCAGCPEVIRKFLIHCRNLSFSECPDYNYLRQMLRHAMRELNIVYDGEYDWIRNRRMS